MKVINTQAAMLCDYEVFTLIETMNFKRSNSSETKSESPVSFILHNTSDHFKDMPCKYQTSTQIDQLLTVLKDFPIRLTKLEKLMICNEPPKTPLQLNLILRDRYMTLSDEDIDVWLQKINEIMT